MYKCFSAMTTRDLYCMLSINDYIYLFLQTLSGRPGGYPYDDLIIIIIIRRRRTKNEATVLSFLIYSLWGVVSVIVVVVGWWWGGGIVVQGGAGEGRGQGWHSPVFAITIKGRALISYHPINAETYKHIHKTKRRPFLSWLHGNGHLGARGERTQKKRSGWECVRLTILLVECDRLRQQRYVAQYLRRPGEARRALGQHSPPSCIHSNVSICADILNTPPLWSLPPPPPTAPPPPPASLPPSLPPGVLL